MPAPSSQNSAPTSLRSSLLRPFQLARLATVSLGARLSTHPARRERALQRVVAQMARMHGLPQKIGQILASAELDGDATHFASLTAHRASALPAAEARRIVAGHLGRPLEEVFSEFNPIGIAASIGQVHRARLRDGREVAVKFQHPGIAATLGADLRALGWLVTPLGNLRRGFDLAGYRAELGERLAAELDYERESAAIREFAAQRGGAPDVLLPECCEELRRPGLLVMTWVDGADIETARRWPADVRQSLARCLVRLFLEGALRDRLLHADPHPGNYRFLAQGPAGAPAVGLLDFGSMHSLRPEESTAIAAVITAARTGAIDEAFAWQFHLAFGYDPTALTPLRTLLPAVLRELLRPVATPGEFSVSDWAPGETLAALLGPHRIAYRVAAPPSFLFLIRAWHGLVHYLRALECPVDWSGLAAPLLPASAPIAPLEAIRPTPGTVLHIDVRQDDRELVRLQLPGRSAAALASLIPLEHRARLDARGFDPARLSARARETGYAPQELFRLSEAGRTVRIWIE